MRTSSPASISPTHGTLDELAGKKGLECRNLVGQTYARLKYGRIDWVFRSGLHEFLTSFIESNNALGVQIQEDSTARAS